MNLFLGDYVTLMNDELDDTPATIVTGQVTGIILFDDKKLDRVYLAGIEGPFYIGDPWKFVITDEAEDD